MQTKANKPFLHTYRLVLWIVLIAILVPVLVTAVYNRPLGDDYAQAFATLEAYQQTGSLWQAVLAAAKAAYDVYIARSGVFFSMFLTALCPSFIDYRLVAVTGMLMPLLMIVSVFYACSCLEVLGRNVSKAAVHCTALLINICLFMFMPDTCEAFYWYSGMINYTFMVSWALIMFTMLFKACHRGKKGVWRVITGCIMAFLLGGANHLTATAALALYAFFAAYIVLGRKPKQYLIPFLFLIAGYALVVLCPGHEYRQSVSGVQLSAFHAFVTSFLQAARYLFKDARWWIALLLFVPVFLELAPQLDLTFRWSWVLPLASVSLLAAHYFPLIYTSYHITGRHWNTFFMSTMMMLALNLLAFIGTLGRYLALRNPAPRAPLPRWLLLCAAVMMILALSIGPVDIECSLPPVNMTVQLLNGDMAEYARDYDFIVEEVRAHPGEDVVVTRNPFNEFLSGPELRDDPRHYFNEGFGNSHGGRGTNVYYYE